jgi:dTDP-4-amino-4,6-dideoxygalactose transaminase
VDPQKAPKARNEIMEYLQQNGISTRPGTHAVHMLSYYKEHFKTKDSDFPVAKQCNDNTMAIPLHNKMSSKDFEYIVKVIKSL